MNKKKSKICCLIIIFTMLISVSSLFSVMTLTDSSTELIIEDLDKDKNELKPISSASEIIFKIRDLNKLVYFINE